ncbi:MULTISPECIES: 4Fe-4S dicluster domain-containing protein [Desulfovibrio]|jgi:adenylylsulfate reductase subunit B|uniref:4Fe-4S dicluster domain-containing protein n=1 Tax=Desulfovibrio TaxID=872 RepID=UPI000968BAED|nr:MULTISPECIES: ferredoxin family protein [Desulfovibrio]MBM6835740.1 4Fe-4S binding protein [Desulfovibrio piger]MBM6894836.1 4Fe-4S binding protein [Desulfovibrio piger]MBS5808696.1 4Fe-4S binding protein [Desulfovibrio piger]MCI6333953.1 ferredoxin family protein [Desulfovibrio piger]MCI6940615.1 ferredoxin family protein [Desulfovibrio piger]
MPPRIDLNKCNGCGGKPETACEMVCPGDLMMLDPETGKARCRATGECWDCMSCIKVCPTGALQTRMPYQLGYYKASLRPIMGKDCITWKCRDIDGNEYTYKYVNRIRH